MKQIYLFTFLKHTQKKDEPEGNKVGVCGGTGKKMTFLQVPTFCLVFYIGKQVGSKNEINSIRMVGEDWKPKANQTWLSNQ